MLTRYAGLSIFVTSCLVLALWPGRGLLDRIRTLALYAGSTLPLSGVWLIRNQMSSGTLTGNNELVHGLTFAEVVGGLEGSARGSPTTRSPIPPSGRSSSSRWDRRSSPSARRAVGPEEEDRRVRRRAEIECPCPRLPCRARFVHHDRRRVFDSSSPVQRSDPRARVRPALARVVVLGHELWTASGRFSPTRARGRRLVPRGFRGDRGDRFDPGELRHPGSDGRVVRRSSPCPGDIDRSRVGAAFEPPEHRVVRGRRTRLRASQVLPWRRRSSQPDLRPRPSAALRTARETPRARSWSSRDRRNVNLSPSRGWKAPCT